MVYSADFPAAWKLSNQPLFLVYSACLTSRVSRWKVTRALGFLSVYGIDCYLFLLWNLRIGGINTIPLRHRYIEPKADFDFQPSATLAPLFIRCTNYYPSYDANFKAV